MSGLIVRAARADDYQDVHEVLACPGVVRDTLQLPYVSMDKRKEYLEELPPGDHYLVAETGGRVVGTLSIHRRKDRLAHVAGLGMAVHDDYHNQGIGTALMEAAMDLVDNWINLKRLELDVFTDNQRAIHLYEKFGFVIEGTRRALAVRDGEYVEAHSMARVREGNRGAGGDYRKRLAKIRSRHPRAYEKWTADEDLKLTQLVQSGRTEDEITAKLQRQPGAIRNRMLKLGLMNS